MEEEYTSCEECKHCYDLDIVGWCNTCVIGCCYLCAHRYKYCGWFEKSNVPLGKTEGKLFGKKKVSDFYE